MVENNNKEEETKLLKKTTHMEKENYDGWWISPIHGLYNDGCKQLANGAYGWTKIALTIMMLEKLGT